MKLAIVGIAALQAASLASAQSSLTLFGIADAGISRYEATARNPMTGGTITQRQSGLSSGGNSTSRLGFRGTEDLGGGLSAGFWLESAIALDTGSIGGPSTAGAPSATAFFNRRSTLSLAGGFGELRLGRDYNPTFYNDAIFDPFGNSGVGSSVLFTLGNSAAVGNSNYVRANNSVSYFLPSALGGVYGSFMYGMPENTKTSGVGVADGNDRSGAYIGGRIGYAAGSLDLAIAHGESKASDTEALRREFRTTNIGVSYDFGLVKAFGELSRTRDQRRTPLIASEIHFDGYLVGASVPVGVGLIRVSYSAVRYKSDEGITGASAPRVNKLAIGYTHNLSKRTAVYVTAARINNKNDGAYAGSLPNAAVATGGTASFSGAAQGYLAQKATGYDVGIRHAF
ncbi:MULTISPECIES: porin [unclassified Variovorax]|uniref:porin n=1 Tax=unclassified Variovorax TaxID=663243 RepID=UPI003F47519E